MEETKYTPTENTEVKKKEKTPFKLPVYEDIRKRYASADRGMKALLMELAITRALRDNKNLKKELAVTFDNRRDENGRIRHLIGFYSPNQMSEIEADDFICSDEAEDDIQRMWIIDKHNDLARLLKG